MPSLVEKVVAISTALDAAEIPYAFGGALALAYATSEPRGTRDIDVNVFVPPADVRRVFDALPSGVKRDANAVVSVGRDEQVRLWWDDTPIDVFFAAHPFHLEAGRRRKRVDFVGTQINVLEPADLAVFKVLFDRSKDWVDVEAMVDSGTLDVDAVANTVSQLLGDDPRVDRLRRMSH